MDFKGVTYPAINEVWSHWAPPTEKSRLVSIGISGGYFGAVFAMPICSVIATIYDWESIFYVFGRKNKIYLQHLLVYNEW